MDDVVDTCHHGHGVVDTSASCLVQGTTLFSPHVFLGGIHGGGETLGTGDRGGYSREPMGYSTRLESSWDMSQAPLAKAWPLVHKGL